MAVLFVLGVVLTLPMLAGVVFAVWVDSEPNASNAVGTGILAPPTSLTASDTPVGSVTLGWTPTTSTWAAGYTVQRSLTSGSGYGFLATVPGQASSAYVDVVGGSDTALIGSWATGLTHTAPAGTDRALVVIAGSEDTSTVTLGTAWKATPTSSTETPSMSHSGPNRQVIAAARLHDAATDISLLGSWGAGLSHTAGSGTDRLLVFMAGNEENPGPSPTLSGVTYGGQALTFVAGVSVGSGVDARVEIWVLDEAGIAAASGTTFIPTWSAPPHVSALLPRVLRRCRFCRPDGDERLDEQHAQPDHDGRYQHGSGRCRPHCRAGRHRW
ncbi:MAG: hypothetical protein DK306_001817 [Chloroflexi bacterium]|nr:MAG: hypothetical protein DK306_001817 [Chloroflexota bacterium]